ncbi:hypothetical protein ACNAN0_07850 [Agrilactobacillus fermenti]|uniref:hypothetical protein n=1 Tax=Agrilactobacillus fermenti TaxID=2586909 RepID=UPI001E29D750|nr:hypothetical protein [Agrilactobacillus fermenti]MCD2256467.1 hypothetical protein [Agrilactobacillus fermenti]
MLITIAILIFLIVVAALAIYLLRHSHTNFLGRSMTDEPVLKRTMQITAYALLLIILVSVILLFVGQPKLQVIPLLLASFIVAFFAVSIGKLM